MHLLLYAMQSRDGHHHLHIKEGCAGVGSADGDHTRGAHFLQGQQEHGPAKNRPPAAPEATGVVRTLLVLQLAAGCLKRHASVKDDVIAVGLQAVVGVHPQGLQRHSTSLTSHDV